MLAVPFVQVALVMDQTGHRIVLFLLPLYALFVAFGLASLVAAIRDRSLPPRLLIATLLAGALQGGAVLVAAQRPKAMKAVYASGYLLPDQSRQGHPEIERELRWLRTQVADEDLVLTSNPWISDHYVGKTDGIIRQHPNGARGFTTFPEPRDEYFGATTRSRSWTPFWRAWHGASVCGSCSTPRPTSTVRPNFARVWPRD